MKIPKRINDIIEELKDQYLEEDRCNRPWIIGFSGGKDSTVLLTLTWLALQQLKEVGYHLMRQVYVDISSSTHRNDMFQHSYVVLHSIGVILILRSKECIIRTISVDFTTLSTNILFR